MRRRLKDIRADLRAWEVCLLDARFRGAPTSFLERGVKELRAALRAATRKARP